MNEIQDALLALLPYKRKVTPSGWTSFNGVCCHHRGEKPDDRQRGGIMSTAAGGFTYHCFNCNFKAGWSPGKLLSNNTKSLFRWLGMSDSDISRLGLLVLKLKDDQPVTKKALTFELVEKPLPDDCLPVSEWIKEGCEDEDFLNVVDYVINERKMGWDWYNWHWSAAPGYRDRVILPFYHDGKIVGSTGRKITPGKPKYLTDAQPGYVFNLDAQTYDRSYVIVVEGQFDAIAVDGVAIMHNEPNETQCARIKALGREVIVVPDKDQPGAKMIKAAIDNEWSASLPPWEDDIKDVADAIKKYGRLYVLTTILHYKVNGEIKLNLLKKRLEGINDE
jgi:hypothetical protein